MGIHWIGLLGPSENIGGLPDRRDNIEFRVPRRFDLGQPVAGGILLS
jgi:hypothetical protein